MTIADHRAPQHRHQHVQWLPPQNGSTWTGNEYNDDISWACIAFARAYLITGNMTYRDIAKANWDAMYNRAWDTNYFGGGLWWRQSDRQSKNACIQGPATIAACYLYNISGDTNYLNKAQAIYAWNRKYLFNTNSGRGLRQHQHQRTADTVALTYNQGTFIGSANLLILAPRASPLLSGRHPRRQTHPEQHDHRGRSAGVGSNPTSRDSTGFYPLDGTIREGAKPVGGLWSVAGDERQFRLEHPQYKQFVPAKVAHPNARCQQRSRQLGLLRRSHRLASRRSQPGDFFANHTAAGFTAVTEARRFPAANGTVLTLTNTGGAALNWSLSNTSARLTVSANSGVLNVATAADVTVNLATSVVTNLPAGRYFANVALTNVTTGSIAQRIFTLVIAAGDAPILTTGQNGRRTRKFGRTPRHPEHQRPRALTSPNSYTFFQAGLGSSTRGLPPDGVSPVNGIRKPSSNSNPTAAATRWWSVTPYPNSATLTLTTPQTYKSSDHSRVLGECGGSGTFVLNFTNGHHQPALSFNAPRLVPARPPTLPFKQSAD